MLQDSQVTANIPAADLERARLFYEEKLGLTPADENPGGLIYKAGGTAFFLYQTDYAGQAGHTIAQFHVSDVRAEVDELRSRGVTFEHYDMPGITWDDDIATLDGTTHAAWFKDSEDNILCLDDESLG
jgi:catechol 2,3-dioxygenase-like lactoylglutathione lyase family enzyme